MRRFLRFQILLALLALPMGVALGQQRPVVNQPEPMLESVDAKLRLAASHYAIIQILLDEGKVDQVAGEFQKILDLDLRGGNERQVGQAAWQIVHRLADQQHYSLAHHLVEITLKRVEEPETQFSLLMLQAKVFQAQRLLPQAIDAVRRAQGILNQGSVPE